MVLFSELKRRSVLWTAWTHVRANGYTSRRKETRDEIQIFEQEAPKNIASISSKLSHKTFEFSKEIGIRKRKLGKSGWRPIVMGTVSNRVVRRAILETLQSSSAVSSALHTDFSYGGIKNRGVKDAVLKAAEVVNKGGEFYFASDISSFFTNIPRKLVEEKLRSVLQDDPFSDVFEAALTTELENMADLAEDAEQFPIHDIGVAQGCCLSPLIGNILLEEFDKSINSSDVTGLRYIDDFIIIGPSKKAVMARFREGKRILDSLGLGTYSPQLSPDKASTGKTAEGFKYLGCELHKGLIRPDLKSWKKLQKTLIDLIELSLNAMVDPADALKRRLSFSDTISQLNLVSQSWFNQYAFCTDKKFLTDAKCAVGKRFDDYEMRYFEIRRRAPTVTMRRKLAGFRTFSES